MIDPNLRPGCPDVTPATRVSRIGVANATSTSKQAPCTPPLAPSSSPAAVPAPLPPGSLTPSSPTRQARTLPRPCSLIRWITGYLNNRPGLTHRVAHGCESRSILQIPSNSSRRSAPAIRSTLGDTAIHLNQRLRWNLDVEGLEEQREAGLADWIREYRWPKGSSAEAVEQLDQMLHDAGSALTVDWSERSLKRRVDATAAMAAEQTMAATPSKHPQDAWAAVYGRHPGSCEGLRRGHPPGEGRHHPGSAAEGHQRETRPSARFLLT
jgi:hypothetical protein